MLCNLNVHGWAEPRWRCTLWKQMQDVRLEALDSSTSLLCKLHSISSQNVVEMEHSEKWQTTVFRVQGLPNEVRDVHGVASLLSARLDDLPVSSIRVYSLATALHVSYSRNPSRTKVATVMFEKVPLVVQKAPAQEEWQLPVRSHNHIDAVSLDTHFSGMTPLNDAGTEYSFEYVSSRADSQLKLTLSLSAALPSQALQVILSAPGNRKETAKHLCGFVINYQKICHMADLFFTAIRRGWTTESLSRLFETLQGNLQHFWERTAGQCMLQRIWYFWLTVSVGFYFEKRWYNFIKVRKWRLPMS